MGRSVDTKPNPLIAPVSYIPAPDANGWGDISPRLRYSSIESIRSNDASTDGSFVGHVTVEGRGIITALAIAAGSDFYGFGVSIYTDAHLFYYQPTVTGTNDGTGKALTVLDYEDHPIPFEESFVVATRFLTSNTGRSIHVYYNYRLME